MLSDIKPSDHCYSILQGQFPTPEGVRSNLSLTIMTYAFVLTLDIDIGRCVLSSQLQTRWHTRLVRPVDQPRIPEKKPQTRIRVNPSLTIDHIEEGKACAHESTSGGLPRAWHIQKETVGHEPWHLS